MSFEKNIDELFKIEEGEGQESSSGSATKSELPKIEAPPPPPESDGIERREFTRIDLTERQIAVRFHNEAQFAKHYIENISLGGMFIKTKEKYKMGEIVPVSFEVRTHEFGEPELFQLKGQVCRVIESGVGISFTNLDQVTRTRLESYVQSVLPKGAQVRTKAKQSTVDRLEQMRQEKEAKNQFRKKTAVQVALLIVLALANGILVEQQLSLQKTEKAQVDQILEIDGKRVKVAEIRSLKLEDSSTLTLRLQNEEIIVPIEKVYDQLPPHLKNSVHLLQSTPPRQKIRRSKNAGRITDMRNRDPRSR